MSSSVCLSVEEEFIVFSSPVSAVSLLLKVSVHGWNICKPKAWSLSITAIFPEARGSVIFHTQKSFLSLVKTVIWRKVIISAELPTCRVTLSTVWNYTVFICCYFSVVFYFPFPTPMIKPPLSQPLPYFLLILKNKFLIFSRLMPQVEICYWGS